MNDISMCVLNEESEEENRSMINTRCEYLHCNYDHSFDLVSIELKQLSKETNENKIIKSAYLIWNSLEIQKCFKQQLKQHQQQQKQSNNIVSSNLN